MNPTPDPARPAIGFVLMDAPFESARSALAFRLLDAALRRGHDVHVFAYEGAVMLPFARQQPHANAVHGRSVEEENHFLPRTAVAALFDEAARRGRRFEWINCGLCVDERGAGEPVAGVRRGTPADFWQQAQACAATLVIPTRA